MREPAQPFSLAPGQGRVLPTRAGGQVTFKVTSEQASDTVSVLEFDVPVGAGPRVHVHEQKEECIYVLQGELRVQLGDATHDTSSGSCVFIPRGTPHSFVNVGNDRAKLLAVYAPGGIEEFFENFAAGNERAVAGPARGDRPLPPRRH